jgi:hypothetical protein
VLPVETLRDATWYGGLGRNATVGLWDARTGCFWTIVVNDFANPARFPAKPLRQVRLKREDYLSSDGLNDAALEVQRLGLPPDILKRTHRLDFGPCLTVFFIGRQDQVALKLCAAIDVPLTLPSPRWAHGRQVKLWFVT